MSLKSEKSNGAKIVRIVMVLWLVLVMAAVGFNFIPHQPIFEAVDEIVFENEAVRITHVGTAKALNVGYFKKKLFYALEDHFVYAGDEDAERLKNLGHFSKVESDIRSRVKDFVARLNVTRLVRSNIVHNQMLVLDSGTILIFYDHIYRSTNGGRSFTPVFKFDNQNSTPFVGGIAVDDEDNVYFGEYDCTARPHGIDIFQGTEDGQNWRVVHHFPAGEIFHVHSIKYDAYRDRLWISTGDRDEESHLLYTDDEFETMHTLGGGDQGWRIVSLIIDPNYLYWGSDNDRTGSHFYRYNLDSDKREKVLYVGKPSYFSTKLYDGTFVINTVYEPESPFTKEHDPDPTTDIWISKNGLDWHRIITLPHRSDDFNAATARASNILPGGEPASFLYMMPQSTLRHEFSTLKYKIDWKE